MPEAEPIVDSTVQEGIAEGAPLEPLPKDRMVPLKALEAERAKRQAEATKRAEAEAKAAEAERLRGEAEADASNWRSHLAAEAERVKTANKAALDALDEGDRAEAEAAIEGLDDRAVARVLAVFQRKTVGQPRNAIGPSADARPTTLNADEKAYKARKPFLHDASDETVKKAFLASNPNKKV